MSLIVNEKCVTNVRIERVREYLPLYSSLCLILVPFVTPSLRLPVREVIRRFWNVISRNAIYAEKKSRASLRGY